MTSWQKILADIYCENDFDPNESDFETNLGSEAGIDDPHLTVSMNEVTENCGGLFDLSTPADVETGQSDSEEEEMLCDLLTFQTLKEVASDRYNICKGNNDSMFSDRVVPRMDLFESSLANFSSQSTLKRFLTGLGVVSCLQEKNMSVTDTVQRNRLPRSLRQNFAGECRKRFFMSVNKSKRRYCTNVLEGQSCCSAFQVIQPFNQKHHARDR